MVTTDIFGIQLLKPSQQGGESWIMNNSDFNNDSQVYTFSTTGEYGVTDEQDDAGVRWTLSTSSDPFYTLISSSRGLDPTNCTLDQNLMVQRQYMQSPRDWKNVEFTGNFKIVQQQGEGEGVFRIGFRGAKHSVVGPPGGCTGSNYVVEIPMSSGGVISVKKESFHASFYEWLTTRVSGFDATLYPCGFTIKVLCYNTKDNTGVTVEVWLDRDNENEFELVLSGTDRGQINTDASACGCSNIGQPLIWGSPTVLLQQQGGNGKLAWKNLSIREIDPYGTGTSGGTAPALDRKLVVDPPAVSNAFTDINGDILSSARVHIIFWGNDWNTRTQPYGKLDIQNTLIPFFKDSWYFDYLIEYNIKRPILGTFAINTTFRIPTTRTLTHSDIEDVVKNSIEIGLVPANVGLKDRNMYVVLPPFGFLTTTAAAGGHAFYPYPQNDTLPKNVYAWLSYTTSFSNFTISFTRLLVNTISDPIPGTGIIASSSYVSSLGYPFDTIIEVADMCPILGSSSAYLSDYGIYVAKYYSNAVGECWAPSAPVPFITCSSNSMYYDNISQTCIPPSSTNPLVIGPGELPPAVTPVYGVGIVDAGGALNGVEYQVGYRVTNFTASAEDGYNIANNVGDGYNATRWSAFGTGQWIKADLGAAKDTTTIKIAWYRGEVRAYDFLVYTSTDDITYTLQYTGTSTKGNSDLQTYVFSEVPVSARYVAVLGTGNTENNWISITEIQIWGPDVPTDPGRYGGLGTGSGAPPAPIDASYTFIDTSFSVDFETIGVCNPVEG